MNGLVSDASAWLQSGQRWNLITLLICSAALIYVALKMLRRTREMRAARQAAASDALRLSARRYHETAWN